MIPLIAVQIVSKIKMTSSSIKIFYLRFLGTFPPHGMAVGHPVHDIDNVIMHIVNP